MWRYHKLEEEILKDIFVRIPPKKQFKCILNIISIKKGKPHGNRILTLHLRSSDITKRLLWDMLLVQRIGEYIYGTEISFHLFISCPNMYTTAELLCMYHTHESVKKLLRPLKPLSKFQGKIKDTLKYFLTVNIDEVKYKVHKRCIRQLQAGKKGMPEYKSLKAKEIKL